MLKKIGLLNKGLDVMVPTAWEIYEKWENDGRPCGIDNKTNSIAIEFKKTFCLVEVDIEFMGLWDSVNSSGLLNDRYFPCTSITHHVKHIRHAISIDEKRSKFVQNLFDPLTYLCDRIRCDTDLDHSIYAHESEALLGGTTKTFDYAATVTQEEISSDLLEVWFPGDHSDVGGGWPVDFDGHVLSNISLRWMLSFSLEFGVLFKKGAICEFSTKFPTLDSVLSSHHNALCLHAGQYSVKPGFTGNLFKRVYEDITGGTSTPSSVGTSPDTNELFCEPSAKTTTLPEEPIKKYDCRACLQTPFI
ncbi:unnamed protein product [Ambrosiozyma monospora]|uniref:Unnamed protein product n=1 Tax=Ambrosiozyma monospora TaxID=43982 RepID=A0ACB5UBJ6_AMBMO|nr:unnamed protein product [Ambrosiozyma monospora]